MSFYFSFSALPLWAFWMYFFRIQMSIKKDYRKCWCRY